MTAKPPAKSRSTTRPHRWTKGQSGNPSGRRKGVPNKATAEVKELAAVHAPAVITELARLALGADSEAARVAAGKELLDRAYGKATQPVTAEVSSTVKAEIQSRIDWSAVPLELRRAIANLPRSDG